jgi:hypothetical protein
MSSERVSLVLASAVHDVADHHRDHAEYQQAPRARQAERTQP